MSDIEMDLHTTHSSIIEDDEFDISESFPIPTDLRNTAEINVN
jgi:hypothetical protein